MVRVSTLRVRDAPSLTRVNCFTIHVVPSFSNPNTSKQKQQQPHQWLSQYWESALEECWMKKKVCFGLVLSVLDSIDSVPSQIFRPLLLPQNDGRDALHLSYTKTQSHRLDWGNILLRPRANVLGRQLILSDLVTKEQDVPYTANW